MSGNTSDQEALSRWAESDSMPEAIRGAKFVGEGNEETRAAARAMLEAAAGGRPNVGSDNAGSGDSPRRQVRLTQAMSDRLDAYARKSGQNPSEIMRTAIGAYLDQVA